MSFSIRQIPEHERKALNFGMPGLYNSTGCGICEKPGAEVYWFSPFSRCAHARCVMRIEPAETMLNEKIDRVFSKSETYEIQNEAHYRAIEIIKIHCGSGSLMQYLEKYGLDALTLLFVEKGFPAIKRYGMIRNQYSKYRNPAHFKPF